MGVRRIDEEFGCKGEEFMERRKGTRSIDSVN